MVAYKGFLYITSLLLLTFDRKCNLQVNSILCNTENVYFINLYFYSLLNVRYLTLTSSIESHFSGKIPKLESIFIDLYMLASNCWLDEI